MATIAHSKVLHIAKYCIRQGVKVGVENVVCDSHNVWSGTGL